MIGGRFGKTFKRDGFTITERELKIELKLNKLKLDSFTIKFNAWVRTLSRSNEQQIFLVEKDKNKNRPCRNN